MQNKRVRVLYSFPHPLGNGRIADTAWYQIKGVADAGAEVTVFAAHNYRPLPNSIRVHTTLSKVGIRIPYRVLGRLRAFGLHDRQTARFLARHRSEFDVVHVWPLGATHTLEMARRLGIPAVLERPNAHTRYAYRVVREECERLGVEMPSGHEHAYDEKVLLIEEREYGLATKLMCPSGFVAQTFHEYGFPESRLLRHQYGFDETVFHPPVECRKGQGLKMIFVGGCAPRKGLHYALDAWLRSPASTEGKFLIAGEFIPGYAESLSRQLAHPSVEVLGHRTDVAELMRGSDVFTLPSIEEGSALVTSEARGSGCVLAVSDASGAICQHMVNGLVHHVGDTTALTEHLTLLHTHPEELQRLRAASLDSVSSLTWVSAGRRLLECYQEVVTSEVGAPVTV